MRALASWAPARMIVMNFVMMGTSSAQREGLNVVSFIYSYPTDRAARGETRQTGAMPLAINQTRRGVLLLAWVGKEGKGVEITARCHEPRS